MAGPTFRGRESRGVPPLGGRSMSADACVLERTSWHF